MYIMPHMKQWCTGNHCCCLVSSNLRKQSVAHRTPIQSRYRRACSESFVVCVRWSSAVCFNRYFYRTASSPHPVSMLILHPRDILTSTSSAVIDCEPEKTETMHSQGVNESKRDDNVPRGGGEGPQHDKPKQAEQEHVRTAVK